MSNQQSNTTANQTACGSELNNSMNWEAHLTDKSFMDFLQAVDRVNVEGIAPSQLSRCTPRKEQAKAARELFKVLGIKGISVTAPNYSMAQSVHVRIPSPTIEDSAFCFAGVDYRHATWSDMPSDVPAKIIHKQHNEVIKKIGVILAVAFPNHDDRSDSQTDYFDYCWSIR